jgi:hypothetical protein
MPYLKLTFANRDPETVEVDGPVSVEIAAVEGLRSTKFDAAGLVGVEYLEEEPAAKATSKPKATSAKRTASSLTTSAMAAAKRSKA